MGIRQLGIVRSKFVQRKTGLTVFLLIFDMFSSCVAALLVAGRGFLPVLGDWLVSAVPAVLFHFEVR